jgi:transcriptional regulator with XRE-family HTH domain
LRKTFARRSVLTMSTPTHPPQAHAGVQINGDNLRRAMRLLGWSQEELARRSGVAGSHISRLLKGENGARVSTVRKLIAAFGGEERFSWADLVVDEEETHDTGDE